MVITLVLFGKWLEGRAKRQTGAAIRALMALRRKPAALRAAMGQTGRADRADPAWRPRRGAPGGAYPGGREILEGASAVDESLLTGESLPVAKAAGDRVTGGAVNGDGAAAGRNDGDRC